MSGRALSLFEAWGIELEYMIVDRASLDVRPIADEVLRDAAGVEEWVEDVDDGPISWSNELVCHVVELKCSQPVATLEGLAGHFENSLARLERTVAGHGACLMPGGMHPWMDPTTETRIWPHETGPIYNAYDRLFNCRRHGWANLQSMHINLPFADADEFARLMAAIRLVVPLIPALAASSPIFDGASSRRLDSRLVHYRRNATLVPSMAGDVVPEAVFDIAEDPAKVLEPISRELRACGAGPELLARDWLNARGAIARFDRMAIEIRVADTQERPRADLAVAAVVGSLVRSLVEQRFVSHEQQRAWPSSPLVKLLGRTTRRGPDAMLPTGYAPLFGVGSQVSRAGDLWRELLTHHYDGPVELEEPLEVLLREGTLAQRLLRSLGAGFDRADLEQTYRRLSTCLHEGRAFLP